MVQCRAKLISLMPFLGKLYDRIFIIVCLLAAALVFENGARRDARMELGTIPRNSILSNATAAGLIELFELTFGLIYGILLGLVLLRLSILIHWQLRFPRGLIGSACILVLANLIADFGKYWFHRLFHASPVLLPIHRVHHSDEYMNVTTAFRGHWIERLVNDTLQVLPALILPMTGWMIVVLGFFETIRNFFTHVGAPVALGRISGRIFVSPYLHRVHHSLDPAHFNTNFSNTWIFWDYLFGTICIPESCTFVETGAEVHDSPASLLRQMINPFSLWRPVERAEMVPDSIFAPKGGEKCDSTDFVGSNRASPESE